MHSMLGFALIIAKNASNAKMKRYGESRSPCLVSLSSLKCDVVLTLLIIHDSSFLINIFILFINSLPDLIF